MQIINNKYLRYGPWVYWQDIIRNNDAPIEIQFNGARGQCMKIYLLFLSCLFPPIFFPLLSFSQAGVTSLVETTAGAQTRTSVRSVSAQFDLCPVPLQLALAAISVALFSLLCHSDKDGVRAAVQRPLLRDQPEGLLPHRMRSRM